MVYDLSLAARVRDLLGSRRGVTEKKMFGGIAFLLNGNMCVAVWKDFLILRLGVDEAETALQEPGVVEFDVTGRPMKGWVMVELDGLASDVDLKSWVERAVKFVHNLSAK
jgi:TfoX/Sxy family transcriptional regulator of competence genes